MCAGVPWVPMDRVESRGEERVDSGDGAERVEDEDERRAYLWRTYSVKSEAYRNFSWWGKRMDSVGFIKCLQPCNLDASTGHEWLSLRLQPLASWPGGRLAGGNDLSGVSGFRSTKRLKLAMEIDRS